MKLKINTMTKKTNFIQLNRCDDTYELMKLPNVFILLTQIAIRAKRTDKLSIHNLEIWEAFLWDHENIWLTKSKYRTAKKKLESLWLATFKWTSKWTVWKLINNTIFDINAESNDYQITNEWQSDNYQVTTNNNDKNEKNDNIDNAQTKIYWKSSLSDNQINKLKIELGSDYEEYIEKFDSYTNKKQKIYKNPVLELISWWKEDDPIIEWWDKSINESANLIKDNEKLSKKLKAKDYSKWISAIQLINN